MTWFLVIFGIVILAMFCLGIWAEKSNLRRKYDSDYDQKVTNFWNKVDPYWVMTEKIFAFIFVIAVIYYIYLG